MPIAPTITIRVRTNARDVARQVRGFTRDQAPFATARALTDWAQDARDDLRRGMRRRFKIRSQRVIRGITIERANKRDFPRIQALVGTRDDFIARFEKGGVQRGRRRFAVPTKPIVARRTATGRIPASLKPRRILAKGGTITGGDVIRLARKRKKTLGGISAAFTLHRRINLRPRLRLEKTAERVGRQVFARHFKRRLREAVATRRR